MRAHALVILALLASLPNAAAQVPTSAPSATTVTIAPLEGPLSFEAATSTRGVVEYSYSVLGAVALAPTRVDLMVTDAPAWAVVVVSPETLQIVVSPTAVPGTTVQAPPREFTVTVSLLPDAPLNAAARIRVEAVAHPNAPIGPSSGADSVLATTPAEGPCAEAAAADTIVILEEAPAEGELQTASAAATPALLSPVPAVLGLAGAGAGAGVAYARRRK